MNKTKKSKLPKINAPPNISVEGREAGAALLIGVFLVVLLGLALIRGFAFIGPKVALKKAGQSQTSLNNLDAAIMLFATTNSRLPCPADGSLASTDSKYGLEAIASTTPKTCTTAIANSVIPWRTLGLQEETSLDAQNNRVSYIPAGGQNNTSWDNLVDSGAIPLYLSQTGHFATNSSNATGAYIPIYTADASGNLSSATTSTNQAAYVLISHGASGAYGWTKSGTLIQDPQGSGFYTLKSDNSQGNAKDSNGGFVQSAPTAAASSHLYFDDVVFVRTIGSFINEWGKATAAIQAGGGSGSLSLTPTLSSIGEDGTINYSAKDANGTTYTVTIKASQQDGGDESDKPLCYDSDIGVLGTSQQSDDDESGKRHCEGLSNNNAILITTMPTVSKLSALVYSYGTSGSFSFQNITQCTNQTQGTNGCTPVTATSTGWFTNLKPWQSLTLLPSGSTVSTNTTSSKVLFTQSSGTFGIAALSLSP